VAAFALVGVRHKEICKTFSTCQVLAEAADITGQVRDRDSGLERQRVSV
jgi:hypothetical protein